MRNKFLGTGEPGYHPWRKIAVIVSGLRFAVLYDVSVAWKVVVSMAALAVTASYETWNDFLIILVATGQMLMAEIFNSAIEAVCDYLRVTEDRRIKAIKDMAAAAAGISILFWFLAIGFEIKQAWQAWQAALVPPG